VLEDKRCVGENLDSGTYFSDFKRGFEYSDGVAGEGEGDGGAETTEACADDYYLCLSLELVC